ncbi:hypothetical protein [Pseudoalteromonas prydzensis]|uniref:hypothetical protein n=1 Tax=Pseudoalteromonas prydzensis TaxID=182141 RepID=UPI003FCF3CBA
MTFETVAERINEDSGCPEHDISMRHITATVHVVPDGTGEAFVDFVAETIVGIIKAYFDIKRETKPFIIN